MQKALLRINIFTEFLDDNAKVIDDLLTVIAKERSPKPNRISHRTTCQPPVSEIEKCDRLVVAVFPP
jgi:hypothetical protein